MAENKTGAGYDCEFVTDPPEEFQCEICMLTFRDPHVTSCCGRQFCQLGYERIRRDGKPCPFCRSLTWDAFLHKGLQRQIASLKVYCSNRVLGCQWVGELRDLVRHSASVCDYEPIECRNGCGSYQQRHLLEEHETDHCLKRPIELQLKSLTARLEVVISNNELMRKETKEAQDKILAENRYLKEEMAVLKLKMEADNQVLWQEVTKLRQEMMDQRERETHIGHTRHLEELQANLSHPPWQDAEDHSSEGFTTSSSARCIRSESDPIVMQRTPSLATINIRKKQNEEFGVITSKDMYSVSGTEGFLVIGVSVGGNGYSMLKSGNLRLFDILTQVNGQPVSQLPLSINDLLKKQKSGTMVADRSIAIRCSYFIPILHEVERHACGATHILSLMNNSHRHETFGLSILTFAQKGLVVTSVSEGTIARQSGVLFGDVILIYAIAISQAVELTQTKPSEAQFNKDLVEAFRNGRSVILVIKRQ